MARSRCEASDVVGVVEVVSPGSDRTDRVTKLADYAEAGMEHYLIVEQGPPVTLTEYQLVQGRRYERVAHHEEPAMVRLGLGPLVDLAAPIPR